MILKIFIASFDSLGDLVHIGPLNVNEAYLS